MADRQGVYVIGAGGHAKVVICTLRAAGIAIEAVLDDDEQHHGGKILGIPISGPLSLLETSGGCRAIIAIGNNRARREVAEHFVRVEWVCAIHPHAIVDSTVKPGPGTIVFAGAVIQPEATIGDHVIINTGATVDHDCKVGDYAHIAPGSHLGGNVTLGEGALLGIGSAAIPGAKIGAWTTVGAGGVVINDLPPGVVATGIPAK